MNDNEIKVSQLNEATELNDNDIFMVVQEGVNKKIKSKKIGGNEVLISDDPTEITNQTKLYIDTDTGTATYKDGEAWIPLKDNEVIISDTEPTSNDNEIWVDTSENATYINQEVNIGATNPNNTHTWFKQSKNLFNKDIAQDGFVSDSVQSNSNWYYTTISNWKVGDTLVTSGGRAIISFFNGVTNITYRDMTNATITIPANTTRIYVSTLKANTQFQIEIGNTATAYEPYIRKAININGEDEYYTNDYSTAEQVIGKWINGKPIYRSVIEYTLSIDTSTYYGTYTGAADIIKSIDTLVDYKFYVYNGTLIFPIPNFGGTNNDRDCGIYIQRSYGGIGFQCFARSINNFNGKPAQIILEYTKTTD